jgi:hypothetical protein
VNALVLAAIGAAALAIAAIIAIRGGLGRAQDRLARRLLSERGDLFQLLTRAEMCTKGAYRRLPGVLGLTREAVVFQGLFDETVTLPTAEIRRIVTGARLADGRRLLRREVLRLSRSGGQEVQFVLTRDSAAAWRSHLGLWAVEERRAAADLVSPGKS